MRYAVGCMLQPPQLPPHLGISQLSLQLLHLLVLLHLGCLAHCERCRRLLDHVLQLHDARCLLVALLVQGSLLLLEPLQLLLACLLGCLHLLGSCRLRLRQLLLSFRLCLRQLLSCCSPAVLQLPAQLHRYGFELRQLQLCLLQVALGFMQLLLRSGRHGPSVC
jgi:hypothetical protein